MALLHVLIFLVFVVLPGSAVTFALPLDSLNLKSRIAIGVALSPFIVALAMGLLESLGLDFMTAACIVLAAALFGVPFFLKALRRLRFSRPSASTVVGALILLVIFTSVLWVAWQGLLQRQFYSTHGFLHTDICYSLMRPGLWPEDSQMAGQFLTYYWLSHYYWACLGWLTDIPPNSLYRLTNTVWLWATIVLGYEIFRSVGCRRATSLIGVALLFSGSNCIALVIDGCNGKFGTWSKYVGDVRYTIFLGKYFTFNIMPFAIVLVLSLLLALTTLLRTSPTKPLIVLVGLLLVGTGMIYPVIFPPVFCIAATAVALIWISNRRENQNSRADDAKWLLLTVLFASVIVALFVLFLIKGRQTDVVEIGTGTQHLRKAIHMLIALGPLGVLTVPALWSGFRQRSSTVALLVAVVAAGAGMYVVANLLDGTEYKSVFIAHTGVVVLGVISLDRLEKLRGGMAIGMCIVFSCVVARLNVMEMDLSSGGFHRRVHVPELDRSSFWIKLAQTEPDAEWTDVVRRHTPLSTIIVSKGSRLPLAALLRRTEYLATDGVRIGRFGYAVPLEMLLRDVRGYSATDYDARKTLLENLYSDSDSDGYPKMLESLRSFERPLAIHFDSRNEPFLQWLVKGGTGRALIDQPSAVVWFVDGPREMRSGENRREFEWSHL